MISTALSNLEVELQLWTSKEAYEAKKSMNPDYVSDKKFQLKFLRADRFDAKQAALRLVRHFQAKLELFGKSKLVKDIVQDDLDRDDMEALYSGFSQMLPVRDRAGRLVWVWIVHPEHNCLKEEAKVSLIERWRHLLYDIHSYICVSLVT